MTCTLIVDCHACVDLSKADQGGRQADGLREWVAEFDATASTIWPLDGEDALKCPDCGALGRVWSY